MKSILPVFVVAFTLSLAGCGDDFFGTDGSTTKDMTVTLYKIVSGKYTIQTVYDKMDACMILTGGTALENTMWTVTNDGAGNVDVEGFGKGPVAFNMGTLTGMTSTTATMNCPSYNIAYTSKMTVTADNTFTLNYTENETNRQAGCLPMVTGTSCTSTWKMDFKM
jgi:hypothetical protein